MPARGARASVPGERVSPGEIALTVMPYGPSSLASARVIADDAGLARHVVHEAGHHGAERARRHVDDASPAALLHAGHEGGADQEHAVEVDRQHAPPVREGHLLERLLRIDAGAIDQDVAAAEFLLHLVRERRNGLLRSHVAAAGQRLTAGLLDQRHGFVARLDVGDDDVDAVLGETLGERLTDPFAGAGDDGDFVLVAFCHLPLPHTFLCNR